jgi:hypothetical protein
MHAEASAKAGGRPDFPFFTPSGFACYPELKIATARKMML